MSTPSCANCPCVDPRVARLVMLSALCKAPCDVTRRAALAKKAEEDLRHFQSAIVGSEDEASKI